MEQKYVIGVDLGGTNINGALADLSGNVINKYTISTNAFDGQNVVFERISDVIYNVIHNSGKEVSNIKYIGIGSPGPLDMKKGIIITTPNLPFINFKLVELIEAKFKIPTILDNDANVATIGEYMFGAGKRTKNMLYVTVSTGIGAGVVINGNIYRGSTCNALEVGHMTLLENGPRCNCGNYGCAEALASGTAIAKQAHKAIKSGKDTSLRQYKNITSREVFIEAAKGDKVSEEILNYSLNYLGICIANLVTIFDPEVVIIGGGVSKGGDIVFDTVKKVVNERCFKVMASSCKIVPAKLGTDAGVIGAIALVLLESKK